MTDVPPPAKDDVQRLVASGALTSARSPVYLWLWRNYASLTAQLDGARVNWATFAASLGDLGVLDGNGAPPKAETVRRSWWRVRKVKEAARERAQAKRPRPVQPDPVPAPGEVAPGVRLLNADARAPALASDEPGLSETVAPVRQRLALKPAKPRLPPTEGA